MEKQVRILIMRDSKIWYYMAVTSVSALLKAVTSKHKKVFIV